MASNLGSQRSQLENHVDSATNSLDVVPVPPAGGTSVAETVLSHLLRAEPRRLKHSRAVAARAQALVRAVPATDAELLVTAAWLHDIGYAPELADTGFHPLDGARFLRSTGWDPAVCGLVAHHSGARYVAMARGLDPLLSEFQYRHDPVSDALTLADQTTGPDGQLVTIEQRMSDMLRRHGPGSANARAQHQRGPYIRAAAARVLARLKTAEAALSRA